KVALSNARAALTKLEEKLRRKEDALGVDDTRQLKKMAKSKFLEYRMNARALKKRLRDLLRARKFERDRIERTVILAQGLSQSEKKLQTHTESAVKRREPKISHLKNEYNKLCDLIAAEIKKGRAPRGAIAPERIAKEGLYKLDVDDAIWQDVGLGDDDDSVEPPPWLSDDHVRSGIRAVLELERTEEEDVILRKERRSMRSWFIEEWTILNGAMEDTADFSTIDTDAERYQLYLRRERLLRLCATWRKHIRDEQGDAPWGPSEDEL
ncbi:hypothetical protein DFH06DRAFT_947610, partial [Mycena polygramma]